MNTLLSPSELNMADQPPELVQRVHELHRKTLFENLAYSMSAGLVLACGVVWVLWGHAPMNTLLLWLGSRVLIASVRLGHRAWTRSRTGSSEHPYTTYRLLTALDGLSWSALGWALTPVTELDVAVVSISILLAVSAIGVFALYVDYATTTLFISPILAINALYTLTRGDRLGVFACLGILLFWGMLQREGLRSSKRVIELLKLRVQSEQAVAAKAEALRAAEAHAEAKSRFLATMSHEMRTPMHGILGLVRLIRQRESHPDTAQQLRLVESSGEHLVRVINDVLDFSRLEAGSLPIQRQPFDLEALLHEVVDTSQVLAQDKSLKLELHYTAPRGSCAPAYVSGDPVRLRQVLHNLIGNAIKFTQQGHVIVRARPASDTGDTYTLAVEDTGCGIPVEEQATIFEAFQQAHFTQQRSLGGTGLGLTISRELCRAMGGDLRLHSVTGHGSTFTMSLPLPAVPAPSLADLSALQGLPSARPGSIDATSPHGAAPAKGTDDAAPDSAPPAQAHVLLVEDNMVNAIVAEAELSHLGVQVETVRSGLEAVRWLRHHRTDLVLMDGDLPELDGLTATRMVRDHEIALRRPRVPIIALSANGSTDFVDRCLAAGMDDHLAKPFHAGDLARVLSRHLTHLVASGQPQTA